MRARDFAHKAHGEQKYGEKPYLFHLDAVANLVKDYGNDAVTIAYLHDVLEDTQISKCELEHEFGVFIADCVALISDESGKNRKERKAKTYQKLRMAISQYNLALIVKVADRLANILVCASGNHSLLEMYQKEHQAFKSAVYRTGLCDDLWERMDVVLTTACTATGTSGVQIYR